MGLYHIAKFKFTWILVSFGSVSMSSRCLFMGKLFSMFFLPFLVIYGGVTSFVVTSLFVLYVFSIFVCLHCVLSLTFDFYVQF